MMHLYHTTYVSTSCFIVINHLKTTTETTGPVTNCLPIRLVRQVLLYDHCIVLSMDQICAVLSVPLHSPAGQVCMPVSQEHSGESTDKLPVIEG